MKTINVIVIRNNVVESNQLFTGEDAVQLAEAAYLSACREHVSNFDEYTGDDLTAILDNGYCEFGTGSVCISWPECEEQTIN